MNLIDILEDVLNISRKESIKLANSKSIRKMKYREFDYILIRRDFKGYPEGTIVLWTRGKEPKLVKGYPPIKRILLLKKALPRHFIDEVVLEEKMNGYNVRIIKYENEILVITRGGYICPYSTHAIKMLYGSKIEEMLGDENMVLLGEIVGTENPYTRFKYPDVDWVELYIFDIVQNNKLLPINDRRKLIEEYNLKNVPQIGRLYKNDFDRILREISKLEKRKREGIVFKDPYHRVPPLKYTTTFTNINDIEEGMKYFFDEGKTFIFPRVLREIFKNIEEKPDKKTLEERYKLLGKALLTPSMYTVEKVFSNEIIDEEFSLRFYDYKVIDEFLNYMLSLGIQLTVKSIIKEKDYLRVDFLKPKKTPTIIKNIMETGLSPLD